MSALQIVTGASGHLGASLVQVLLAAGRPVRALVMPGDRTAQRLPPDVEIQEGNVLDPASLRQLMATKNGEPPTVYHCAGIVSTAMKATTLLHAVNVDGTKNVLSACREAGVRKLVHVSSVHALPETRAGEPAREATRFDPDSIVGPYAKSKAEATGLVLQEADRGLNASVVFPTGLCGPGDLALGHMTRLLVDFVHNRMPMGVQGGFDFVDVRDVAKGLMQCADKGLRGEGYILGNRFITVAEIFTLFSRFTGAKTIRFFAPMWLARFGLPMFALWERLRKRPQLFNQYALHTLSGHILYSHEKASRDLGYSVRPFDETIRDMASWLKQEGLFAASPLPIMLQ